MPRRVPGFSPVVTSLSKRWRYPFMLIAIAATAFPDAHAGDDGILDRALPTEVLPNVPTESVEGFPYEPIPAIARNTWRAPDAAPSDRLVHYGDVAQEETTQMDTVWQTRNSEALVVATEPLDARRIDPLIPPLPDRLAVPAPAEEPVSVRLSVYFMVAGLLALCITILASINSRRQWRIGSPASKIGTLAEQAAYGSRRWLGPRRTLPALPDPVATTHVMI